MKHVFFLRFDFTQSENQTIWKCIKNISDTKCYRIKSSSEWNIALSMDLFMAECCQFMPSFFRSQFHKRSFQTIFFLLVFDCCCTWNIIIQTIRAFSFSSLSTLRIKVWEMCGSISKYSSTKINSTAFNHSSKWMENDIKLQNGFIITYQRTNTSIVSRIKCNTIFNNQPLVFFISFGFIYFIFLFI